MINDCDVVIQEDFNTRADSGAYWLKPAVWIGRYFRTALTMWIGKVPIWEFLEAHGPRSGKPRLNTTPSEPIYIKDLWQKVDKFCQADMPFSWQPPP